MAGNGWRNNRAGRIGAMLGAFVLALSVGCSMRRTGSDEVAAAVERHQSQRESVARSYAVGVGVHRARVEPDRSSETPTGNAELQTLGDFIGHALEHNPDILAAEKTAAARAQRIPQVTALPDPVLSTKTLPEPVRTAEGDNYFNLGVQQKLPIPAKLDRAGKIALEETRMAVERLEQTRLRVIGDVKRAWFSFYVADRSATITRDNQDLLRGLIEVARGQVAAGTRSQDDVLRILVELSSLEAELIKLRQQRTSATAMLNRLLDREPATPIPAVPDFDIRRVEPKLTELLSRAAQANPELKRLAHRIERDRHAVGLAELARWPDFTLGFEWMTMDARGAFRPPINPTTGRRPVAPQLSEDGSDNWAITFGFNLPIWFDKINAGIRQARRELEASNHAYTSARDSVYFRTEDALVRVRSAQQQAELFANTIIPQAQQAYEVSLAAYSAGTGDFLVVIDNWRKWLMFTILYHRSVGDLEGSIADLEQAVGLSLPEMGESS